MKNNTGIQPFTVVIPRIASMEYRKEHEYYASLSETSYVPYTILKHLEQNKHIDRDALFNITSSANVSCFTNYRRIVEHMLEEKVLIELPDDVDSYVLHGFYRRNLKAMHGMKLEDRFDFDDEYIPLTDAELRNSKGNIRDILAAEVLVIRVLGIGTEMDSIGKESDFSKSIGYTLNLLLDTINNKPLST